MKALEDASSQSAGALREYWSKRDFRRTPNRVRAAAGASASRAPGRRSPLPDFIAPQLAILASEPPSGDQWLYEIKFDGYRMGARLERNKVRLVSRNGNDWTARLATLAQRLKALQLGTGWLDGEIVVTDEAGHTSFQALQKALDRDPGRVEFVVFDVLHWNGIDLRERPLAERVATLDKIFRTSIRQGQCARASICAAVAPRCGRRRAAWDSRD